MSEKFNENNRNDLIKRGFSEEDVSYLESFEYDKTDLYNKICNKIDNFGTSPDKIIMQLKNAVQEELKKQSITNSKQSVEEPHQVTEENNSETPQEKNVEEDNSETPQVKEKEEEKPESLTPQVKNVEEENKPEAVVGGVKTQKNKHKNKYIIFKF